MVMQQNEELFQVLAFKMFFFRCDTHLKCYIADSSSLIAMTLVAKIC